jgi:hypothetical protein
MTSSPVLGDWKRRSSYREKREAGNHANRLAHRALGTGQTGSFNNSANGIPTPVAVILVGLVSLSRAKAGSGKVTVARNARRQGWVAATLACLLSMPVRAETPDYLHGYVDALLDSRFPGYGLVVQALEPEGQVRIAAGTCLAPSQRRDVERLLANTGHVRAVVWDASATCDKPAESESGNTPIELSLLPSEELYAPYLADPRQPGFSMSYQRYDTPNEEFNAAAVSFGEYFPLASTVVPGFGATQIGIQGAVFALFNLDAPSSDLINADYWIGLPISHRHGPRSYRLRIFHQSSHLGDEFLLGNPGIDRINLSYEAVDAAASYEWEQWRVYLGAGYIFHSEPELEPGTAQVGVEYLRPRTAGELDFIAAVDIRAAQELDWSSSVSCQAGFELTSPTARRVRLMLEYFDGHSPNGQFYQERLRYSGLGLYLGF